MILSSMENAKGIGALLGMLAGGLLGTISKFAVALDQVRLQKEEAQA